MPVIKRNRDYPFVRALCRLRSITVEDTGVILSRARFDRAPRDAVYLTYNPTRGTRQWVSIAAIKEDLRATLTASVTAREGEPQSTSAITRSVTKSVASA